MAMRFTELMPETRVAMRARFDLEEQSGNPFRSSVLSEPGLKAFPSLMIEAIERGDEVTLAAALSEARFWLERDRAGKSVNPVASARRLSITEFNTWYVAGLAHRLLAEGESECEVYRAEQPKWEPASCTGHEGKRYPLTAIIDGHRATYWPPPGLPDAFSIPGAPGCHHTIRRCSGKL